MLTFNLKKQWYEKIRSGEKTIEYRKANPYWTKRIRNEIEKNVAFEEDLRMLQFFDLLGSAICFFECRLRLGYTKRFMKATIIEIKKINGKHTDLAIDAPVYAIHLENVREAKQ